MNTSKHKINNTLRRKQDSLPHSSLRQNIRVKPSRPVTLSERGSVTAEYVIATLAAVGFAGLLVVILRGEEVREILTEMVRHALSFGG